MTAPAAKEPVGEIEAVFNRLWPLLRSITGDGVRASLDILGEIVPLERIEVPSGTPVFDWTVPREWCVREAYLTGPDGRRLLDVADNNLHLVNYSAPFRGTVDRATLEEHLFSRSDLPEAVPYVTSYYNERWGFCLSQAQRDALPDGDYRVVIDTEFVDGAMSLAEAVLPGETDGEVLISTYTCHPSMANNELSGPLVVAFLYRRLAGWTKRRLTYRFVFVPETIGAIAYLAQRGDHLRRKVVAGYVATCAGLDTGYTYKRSRRGGTLADRAAELVLAQSGADHTVRDFFPFGSDERQYCSPGFDLPVGSIVRGMYGEYPEYHTSLDNKELIDFAALQQSIDVYEAACGALDGNAAYRNLSPYGEPQLGRRGLYSAPGSTGHGDFVAAMMWVLSYSDGQHDLLDIAGRSGLTVDTLAEAAGAAEAAGLLERLAEPGAAAA